VIVDADVAAPAALIGDQTRAAFLLALSEKDALPASELARRAGVSNSTASIQLGKLVVAELLNVERHGRHRYYRLADPAVADALEALAVIAPRRPVRSLREADRASGIQVARTCYDHLAGTLGVELAEGLVRSGILLRRGSDVDLLPAGVERLEAFGVDVAGARRSRRRFARLCLDWSERRYHLAGALGAALTSRLFELGWIERTGAGRAVRLTKKGREGLRALGVEA
jgi:DNA-binding transcriptional ArsR family regulator